MSAFAPILITSPSSSQSSASCHTQKPPLPACFQSQSQQKTRSHCHYRDQKGEQKITRRPTRAISVSSTEQENVPVVVDIDDPIGSARGRAARYSQGRAKVSGASRADRSGVSSSLANPNEEEEKLHVVKFKEHLRTLKADTTSSQPWIQPKVPHDGEASNSALSSSSTCFGPSIKLITVLSPHDRQGSLKAEPLSQAKAVKDSIKMEPEQAEELAQIRHRRASPCVSIERIDPEPGHRIVPVANKLGSNQSRSPARQSGGIAKGRKMGASPCVLADDDSIIFSEDEEKPVRRRKNSPKKSGQAKAVLKLTKKATSARQAKVDKSPRSTSPTKAKVNRQEAKTILHNFAALSNRLLRGLDSCPLCETHRFGVKQEPPTRRRHVSLCATSQNLTCEDVEAALQQENDRLDQLERERLVREEAGQTAYVRIVETSGLSIQNVKDDGYWGMVGLRANDPRRKARCRLSLAQLAAWAQGSDELSSRKRRKLEVMEECTLRSHSSVRSEVAREACELLGDIDTLESSRQGCASSQVDQDTGDITVETIEATFHFPADQRLAEEKFTQSILPHPLVGDSEAMGRSFPLATQMPSSTFVQRSCSKLARSRPQIPGANNGLGLLFKKLRARAEEQEYRVEQENLVKRQQRLEKVRKAAKDRAILLQKRTLDHEREQRRLDSLRKQNALKEKLAAAERVEMQWKQSGLSWLEWRAKQVEEEERREKEEHDRLSREDQERQGEQQRRPQDEQSAGRALEQEQLAEHSWPNFGQEDHAIEEGEDGIAGVQRGPFVEVAKRQDTSWPCWVNQDDAGDNGADGDEAQQCGSSRSDEDGDEEKQRRRGQMWDEEDEALEEDEDEGEGEERDSTLLTASEVVSPERRRHWSSWDGSDEELEESWDDEQQEADWEAVPLSLGNSHYSGDWRPFNSYDFAHRCHEVPPASAAS